MFKTTTGRFLRTALYAGISGAMLIATSAFAHHSASMFDGSKVLTRKAVVRQWEFTNPHATLWVYIDNDKGEAELWGLESLSPAQLVRLGLNKSVMKPGDAVTVDLSPLRDGRMGGQLRKVTLADGHTVDTGGPTPDGPPPAPGAPGSPAPNAASPKY